MKMKNKILKILRYSCLLFIIVFGLTAIIGSNGGGGDDGNTTLTANITSPSNGSTYNEGDTITFNGTGSDPEDGTLTGASLVWTSSIDSNIGTGTSFTRDDLTCGTHTITLTATDSDEMTGTDSVTLTINYLPTATITSPTDGSTYTEGDTITFSGTGEDAEDGTLSGSSLVWASSIDGQIGTGESFTRNDLSGGIHTITLTTTDSNGATGAESVSITKDTEPNILFVLTKSEDDMDNDGTIDHVSYYIYDANGNRTKEEWDQDNDGTIDGVGYCTYDTNGNMTKKEWDSDNDGTIDRVFYYTYDANGNKTKQEYDNDNDGTIDSVYYYIYDANGNMTKAEYDQDNDGTIDGVGYCTYDTNGNTTKLEVDWPNDGTIDGVHYFTYDANGNRTKEEWDRDNDGTIDSVYYFTWELL